MGIALFGGSFDPIHNGHMSFAEEALKLESVTEIYFIPAFVSPFKEGEEAVSAETRLEMTSLAVEKYENFKVLDLEIRRGGKSYTIDTIHEIINFFPEEEISLMIGQDAFTSIHKWYKAEQLLKMVDLIVMLRPKSDLPLSMDSESGFCYDGNSNVITSSYNHDVHLITENLTDISSTSIRELVSDGKSVDELVPKEVNKYIEKHKLYK